MLYLWCRASVNWRFFSSSLFSSVYGILILYILFEVRLIPSTQSRCQNMWRDQVRMYSVVFACLIVCLFVCCVLWRWHVTQIITILLTWSISSSFLFTSCAILWACMFCKSHNTQSARNNNSNGNIAYKLQI